MNLSPQDQIDLQAAKAKLEGRSLAMTLATKAGRPVEALVRRLPDRVQRSIGDGVTRALTQCLRIAITMPAPETTQGTHSRRLHTAATAVSGAVGGFFGLPGLLVELPVTTTIMLHSIVEIARGQGEDLTTTESALACLQVFALGVDGINVRAVDSAYYATRAALAQATRDAVAYLSQKGMTKEGAPVVLSFLAKIGARFGIEVSEKAAAQLLPIAGAAGGVALNVLFMHHFQQLAEGHFTVRRLERKYDTASVQEEYQRIQPNQSALKN